MTDQPNPADSDRRGFLKGTGAVILGAGALSVPVGAGLAVFLEKQPTNAATGSFIRITSLEALPEDGVPRKFSILAERTNAWNRESAAPIGAIYLRRLKENKVEAFNVICPHAGCLVEYAGERDSYLCPCHESTFALDGSINDPKSPSPRGLDALEVEIRDETEVWVRFQNFRTGSSQKVAV